MNNTLPNLHLLKNDTFRFDPNLCRNANVILMEAKLLRWLFLGDHSSVDIIHAFDIGLVYRLLKQGNLENPLVAADTSRSNIWKLSDDGLEVLKTITGAKS